MQMMVLGLRFGSLLVRQQRIHNNDSSVRVLAGFSSAVPSSAGLKLALLLVLQLLQTLGRAGEAMQYSEGLLALLFHQHFPSSVGKMASCTIAPSAGGCVQEEVTGGRSSVLSLGPFEGHQELPVQPFHSERVRFLCASLVTDARGGGLAGFSFAVCLVLQAQSRST